MQYLTNNAIVTHYQHDFVPKNSCLTNLLKTLETWMDAVGSGYS